MTEVIKNVADEMIAVVSTVMDVSADHQQRVLANQALEYFKENSALCAECGLYMASSLQHSHVVRHVGLLFVEHCIKFQWNTMSQERKVFIKESTMDLLAGKKGNVILEEYHVKSALAKMVVEMIKREWPQHWPDMLPELFQLGQTGNNQTELVLMVLSGLAEDVAIFQNISGQRRRDIHTSLTSSMSDIFNFFINVLKEHSMQYKLRITANDYIQQEQAMQHCKVCVAVLRTLTAYVDWVQTCHITANDNLLLRALCTLLAEPHLRQAVSECLLAIVSRKGKIEDRKPLLILFEEDALATIYEAVRNVSLEAQHQESQYVVLKLLCQVLTALGTQLSTLWNSQLEVGCPNNFGTYLEVILHFTSHPSQILNRFTYPLWNSLLRQKQIDSNPALMAALPRLIEAVTQKLIKVGYPSRMDFVCCAFSRFDFDCDEEFTLFFTKYRNETADLLRSAATKEPTMAFSYASQWLKMQLIKSIDTGEVGGVCSLNSPSYLEWDALSVCLDCVLGRILTKDNPQPPIAEGVRLLSAVVNYETQDPLILSETLSCISALVVFLTAAPETLPAVLNKIFASVVFTIPGQTKANRSKAVKDVRRHACSSLVKVCKNHPKLLLPLFDEVYRRSRQCNADPGQLSQMEQSTLMEALILISNQFENFEKQSLFLKEILSPVVAIWLSNEMQSALKSVDEFFAFIGLGKPPVEPSSEDQCGINRSQILYCVNTIMAAIKRAKWPDDIEVCRRGRFLVDTSDPNIAIPVNPAAEHMLPLIPNVLRLVRMLNCLWQPSILERLSPEYCKAYEMCEVDKNNILGVGISTADVNESFVKSPCDRMQHFLTQVNNNCYHVLGNTGPAFGHDFYSCQNLAEHLTTVVLSDIDLIPDYRLRPLIRIFLKPFVEHCPVEHRQAVVIPVLAVICPYMYSRLTKKWALLNQMTEDCGDEDTREAQEVIEEQLNRQVTREYIGMIGSFLVAKKGTSQDANDVMMEDDDLPTAHSTESGPSELGLLIFKDLGVCCSIVQCLFDSLWWNDTTACTKSIPLCLLSIKLLTSEQVLRSEDADHLFMCTLMSLQRHGQHDGLLSLIMSLCMSTYEMLRPLHASVAKVLRMVPGASEQDCVIFDTYIGGNATKQIPDKKKRELFRGLVSGAIGVSLAQVFQRKVTIENLPPIFRHKPPTKQVMDFDSDACLCTLFSEYSGRSNPV